MPDAPFVHLHVHSEYSILDGACRVPDLVEQAGNFEMPAVTLTDHGSMAGAVQLWKATKGTGVKPIIGCEVYVADDRRAQQKGYAHLTLLARDNAGYSNLIKLSSLGYLEGYYYKPRVDWELLESHRDGLIALSGCLSGRVCKALEENRAAGIVMFVALNLVMKSAEHYAKIQCEYDASPYTPNSITVLREYGPRCEKVVAFLEGFQRDGALARLVGFEAIGRRLDAVIDAVAQHMDQGIFDFFQHAAIEFGLAAFHDELNFFAPIVSQITHQARESIKHG